MMALPTPITTTTTNPARECAVAGAYPGPAIVPQHAPAPTPKTGVLVRMMTLTERARTTGEAWHALLCHVRKPGIQQQLEEIAAHMQVEYVTARRKYDRWRKNGKTAEAVADGRGRPRNVETLIPRETVNYYAGLALGNVRNAGRRAYKRLCDEFRAGRDIPGVAAGVSRKLLPAGWSYQAFNRAAKLSRFEKTAVRIGRGAAASHRAGVYTTRVGMRVGERYQADDNWHDFKVIGPDGKPCRLLQLSAVDVFSGCMFTHFAKPRIEDPETGKRVNFKEHEALLFVAHILQDYGYHPDGCVFHLEHGTMTVSDELEKQLHDISGGRIKVYRGDVMRSAAVAAHYDLSVGGNFRVKALLESLHNLIRNETGFLLDFPGQTGSNSRINLPEELAGREAHLKLLFEVMQRLPVHVREQLRLPMAHWLAATRLVDRVMDEINCRTDHAMEGWEEAGLMTVDYEVPNWGVVSARQYLEADEDTRALVQRLGAPKARRLSPMEVWEPGRAALVRFRSEQIARLLSPVHGNEVVVRDGVLKFEDKRIAADALIYDAHLWHDRDKFRVVVNPCNQDIAHLFDAKGRWIGTCKRIPRVSRGDDAALEEQVIRAARGERDLLQRAKRVTGDLSLRRLNDSAHNDRLIRKHAAGNDAHEDAAYDALAAAVS